MTDLYLPQEAAELLRCSVRTLERDRMTGRGCAFVKLNGRVLYRREDINAYLAANRVQSTSEYATAAGGAE